MQALIDMCPVRKSEQVTKTIIIHLKSKQNVFLLNYPQRYSINSMAIEAFIEASEYSEQTHGMYHKLQQFAKTWRVAARFCQFSSSRTS